jgi:hypothetical protein
MAAMPNGLDPDPQNEVTILQAICLTLGISPRYVEGQTEVVLLRLVLGAISVLVQQGGGGGGDSLPDQSGHAGEFLTTNGSNPDWIALAAGGDMLAATYDPANVAAQFAGASGQAIDGPAFRSALGATTLGTSLFTSANPSAIVYIRVNADNTITLLSNSDFRSSIGAGTSSFTGAYDDLSGKPVLGTAAAAAATDFATAAQGAKADSATQPGDLAAVATSGDYASLTGLPTLGSAAAAATTDFATAAQGASADSAIQPGNGGLVPADTGWTANADAGDKTAAIPTMPDVSALEAISTGFEAWAQAMDKKMKAMEAALATALRPNA